MACLALAQSADAQSRATPIRGQAIVVDEDDGGGAPEFPPNMGEMPMGMPGAVGPDGAPIPGVPPGAVMPAIAPTPEEIARLKALLESLSPLEQEEMKAYYRDLGIDLDMLLGITAARAAEMNRARQVMEALRPRDFSRQPQAVLQARSRLGLGEIPQPDANTGSPQDVAQWIHLQVVAGEWRALRDFLASRPESEAQMIFTTILQSMRGGGGLLPEEVLDLAEAAPAEPTPAQLAQLSGLLRLASDRHATTALMARMTPTSPHSRMAEETRYFGASDAERRRRTIDFLAGAGLLRQAYEFLPSLEEARAAGDGRLILAHGQYQRDLVSRLPRGPEADAAQILAWDLMSEVALMEKVPFETRREAMGQAIALLPQLPRPLVLPWLERVFASETLGPAALEVMAANAASIGDESRDAEERARAILALKEAVDILLQHQAPDSPAFRVPLRMLTTALVSEMEIAVRGHEQQRNEMQPWMMSQPVGRDVEALVRAIPGRAWIDALEPSLASRAAAASIGIAITADEIDLALNLLRDACGRAPSEAADLADGFLGRWQTKLRPSALPDEDTYFFFYRWNMNPAAPLTRGRQRRNMDRLEEMVASLRDIGVEPRKLARLAGVFQACHGATEVFQRETVERVFGPLEQIHPTVSTALAQVMAANLSGDWRDRAIHRRAGAKRTDSEIAQLVDKGYDLALGLMDSALVAQPESWRLAAMKAGLAFDRQLFLEERRGTPSGTLDEVRRVTFTAFEEAAMRYARAVAAGEEREDADVFMRWFGAAMGAPGLTAFRAEEMPAPSDDAADPVERIRRVIATMPADSASRHIAEFARGVTGLVGRVDPSVKPKLVRQALRIVGDHPSGAYLRTLNQLYHDLVRDEIRLRQTVDGADRVGVGRPFGVMLALRCTASVERETGGFSKYLQTSVPLYTAGRYQEKNYRQELEKNIRDAFGKAFDLEAISFFDPFVPPRGVIEDGQDGWMEKPFAYLVITRRDASVDRLPSIPLEMQFSDTTGPVTLVVESNAPPLAIGEARTPRPCPELAIVEVVDLREVQDGSSPEIKIEVRMKGRGVLPDLRGALAGLEDPINGYAIEASSIRESPIVALGDDQTQTGRFFYGPPKPPKEGYPEPDADGIYRPMLERSWVVTYLPAGGAMGSEFRVPVLQDGLAATLETRQYADMDIVPVTERAIPVDPRMSRMAIVAWSGAGSGVVAVALLGLFWVRRRTRSATAVITEVKMPARVTPMSTVTALRRIRERFGEQLPSGEAEALGLEIEHLEAEYFGRASTNGANADGVAHRKHEANGDLEAALRRWAERVEHGR